MALFLAFTASLRLRLITDGCYPPPCSVEPGLSSIRGTGALQRRVSSAYSGCLANFIVDGSTRLFAYRRLLERATIMIAQREVPRSAFVLVAQGVTLQWRQGNNLQPTSSPARNGVRRSSP